MCARSKSIRADCTTHPYYANHHAKENVFLSFVSLSDSRAVQDAPMIYSVWRLDGPTPALPDQGYRAGDWDLHRAAGFKVLEDDIPTEFGTPPSVKCPDAALYAGWYKYGHYNEAFTWKDGAIGYHLEAGPCSTPAKARVGRSAR
jgi:hypothetical protein